MKTVGLAFSFVLIVLPSFVSFASPREIVIGTGEWVPYISKNLKHSGVINHIISDIFARSGIKVKFSFMPWKRVLLESSNGNVDAVSFWGGYEDWYDKHAGSDYIFSGEYVLWQLKGNTFNWKNTSELKGLTMGISSSTKMPVALAEAHKNKIFDVFEVTREEQAFEMLLKKRVHFIPMNLEVGRGMIEKTISPEDREKIIPHPVPIRISLYRLIFSRKSKKSMELMEIFNHSLYILRKAGKIDQYLEDSRQGLYKK